MTGCPLGAGARLPVKLRATTLLSGVGAVPAAVPEPLAGFYAVGAVGEFVHTYARGARIGTAARG